MGVGAGLYMYVVVVQKFTFAVSSPDEFLYVVVLFTKLEMWATVQRDGRPAEHVLCSTPQSLADAHCYMYMPCSNAGKTRKPLKVAGVPQTPETISAASGPKLTILWAHVEQILLPNKFFFPIVDTYLSCEDIARQSCSMVPRWRLFASFLCPVFSASHVQHISDMHSKFALRLHHVWKYGRHPISDR